MLLVLGAPCQLVVLAGPEHGRTIPLADMGIILELRGQLLVVQMNLADDVEICPLRLDLGEGAGLDATAR